MAIKKRPISPRQKMINLMYLVLMAMLALNISTEVLNGFSIVEESLNRTTANSSKENEVLYADFAEQMKANPQKVKEWFDKATAVKRMSDSIYNYAQQLKIEIVREADGKDADVANIKNKDDLEAASHVMLAPGTGQGGRLFRAINSFRERILTMVTDPHQRSIIESNLTRWARTGRSICLKTCLWLVPSRFCLNCRAMCAMPRAKCCTRSWQTST